MYDVSSHQFVPVPEPETEESRKLIKFAVDEIVYVKGMSFRVNEIQPRVLLLEPIE